MNWQDLRITLVGPLPPPAGGMANQTQQLAELLRSEGAEVDVVQVNAPYRPAWSGQFRGVRALFRLLPYVTRLWRSCRRADMMHVMANSGWSWHLFAAPAIWIAAVQGKPAVVNYRGGEADAFLRRAAGHVRPTMRRARALLLPSGFLLDVFARHGMHGRVVPNIIDVDRFHPAPLRLRSPTAPHIVVARNLEPIYGIDIALRAFARLAGTLPQARLTVAGSGPLADALARLAEQLGIANQVRFTGRLDRDQMAELYREADLSFNPSRVDNMPNSVLESLASGVPVVSTRVGGVPYIVEHGRTAMLVPAEDPDAMAGAALRVLTDGALAERLRTAGLVEVQRYRWDIVKNELLAAYRDAVRPARPLAGSVS